MMGIPARTTAAEPKIIQWLLDTRPLWPVPPQSKPREEVEQLKTVASRALSLLTPTEQASVLRYYHLKDAKMSLASHLLKHLIISKYAPTSWAESTISRDTHGKPCFIPRSPSEPRMDFNVSHQAGIVSLIAVVGVGGREKIEVGTDVVCWNERLVQDYASIDKEGFFNWVDIHGDVFAESEISYMKLAPVDLDWEGAPRGLTGFGRDDVSRCQWRNKTIFVDVGGFEGGDNRAISYPSNDVIDRKLRRFYACWCLREAYIKMTGEALLAPWLKELEILNVKAPETKNPDDEDEKSLEAGKVERGFTIQFKGELVRDVLMELTALGQNYMVGGAIRPARKVEELHLKMGKWEHLDLEKDVLAFAESNP